MKSKATSILVILQLAVVFLSWLITAVAPQLGTRSLLSGVGIRWFLGHFADNLAHPILVWLVLTMIAWGALGQSGLLNTLHRFVHRQPLMFRQRFALRVVAIELILTVIVILLLTAVPQAILLSASGNLFPSSFSNSLIPVVMFVMSLMSVSFGLASGTIPHIDNRTTQSWRLDSLLRLGHAALLKSGIHYSSLAFLAILNKARGRWQ